MRVSCSPDGILNPTYPAQGVDDLYKGGFSAMLLDMNILCSGNELEHFGKPEPRNKQPVRPLVSQQPSLLGEYAQKIVSACGDKLDIPLVRAPQLLLDTKRVDLNTLVEQLAVESIKFCGKINCHAIVVRPLFSGVAEAWHVNRAYYLRLAETARRYDVTILLENQCRDFNGHLIRGICSDAACAAEWVDALNEAAGEERFGFCMDTGACRLCGQDMRDFLVSLGARVKAIVLRECDGYHDEFLLPFTVASRSQSQRAWLELIRGLREIRFDGQMILSAADTLGAFSPLLRPQVLSLAYSVARYFQWQVELENVLKKYPSIVLFGAGNMCRNYMKCYGETYPPLFTCSNDERQWGSNFCGLEIKSPEALRDIPPDCAIVICNSYYREIEQQLHKMGLPNKIDFFNDEYLPFFHLGRPEGR